MQLELPGGGAVRLTFVWTTDMVIDFRFDRYSGPPLVYAAKFIQLSKERWSVAMEFGGAPDGKLTFECNCIRLQQGCETTKFDEEPREPPGGD